MKKKSIAVIGLGRFGSALAVELFRRGQEVLGIDGREDQVQEMANQVTRAVAGDARDESVLRAVGITEFDHVIVAVGEVESSAIIALTLKEMGVKHLVCKASSLLHAKLLEKIGVDRVIQPEWEMGAKMARSLSSANLLDYVELAPGCSLVEMHTPAGWCGKTLGELNVRSRYGVNLVALKRCDSQQMTLALGAGSRLEQGDVLVMLGSDADLTRVENL